MGYDANEVKDDAIESPTPFKITDDKENKKITYISNVIDANTLHTIQRTILDELSNCLRCSFGPHGSNSIIKKLNTLNMYTKDGHTILSAIQFNGVVEQSVKDDIETVTLNIAKTVGDGTTSAVMLSKYIFDGIRVKPPCFILKEIFSISFLFSKSVFIISLHFNIKIVIN